MKSIHNSELFYQGRHGPLTKQEQEWGQIAWRYFQTNTNQGTGLVNGVTGQLRTTMWDTADYLAALLAAKRLKLIDEKEFQDRFTKLLATLNTMQLAGNFLPNRYYNTESARPVDLDGNDKQIGWSAMDLGRLLLWLRIARQQRPEFGEYIDRIVLRWDFCQVVDSAGTLYEGVLAKDQYELQQEGRLGYEEYAAQGFQSWGFNTDRASRLDPFSTIKILDIELFYDGRDERQTGTLAPIVSLPYLLSGMEWGWDHRDPRDSPDDDDPQTPKISDLAKRIYQVQEARFRKDKILTARTDHRIGHAPFYVVDSVFVKGYPWNTVSDAGVQMSGEALVATQAVFPMRALFKTDYSNRLTRIIQHLYETDKGWYEGRFERTGGIERTISLQPNAMVLESLMYQLDGKLYRGASKPGFYEVWKDDPYRPNTSCVEKGSLR